MMNFLRSIFFLLLIINFCQSIPVLENVHSGYSLTTIRPSGFNPQTTGVELLPDGRLAVTTYQLGPDHNYNAPGSVYILDGIQGDPNQITVTEFASGFHGAMGVVGLGDTIWVLERDKFSFLLDTDNDGVSDVINTVFSGWIGEDRMWTYGPAYHNGSFYIGMSADMGWPHGQSTHAFRSCLIKVEKNGSYEVVAGGFRHDYVEVTPAGDIFVADNQGQWLPGSKIIHVVPGRYYGHPNIFLSATPYQQQPQSPPAVWIPHIDIGSSPTEPVFIKHGKYAGQLMVGDVAYGGIQRVFLERIQGDYQGAIFQFTGGLEVGINTMFEGPDGTLYVGGLGTGDRTDNFGWRGTSYGLQKLKANGNEVFEMVAIRTLTNGFEIEFSLPLAPGSENNQNFTIERYGWNPQEGYGAGAKVNSRNVSIQNLRISNDRKKITLELNSSDLEHESSLNLKSTTFHFSLSNIRSNANEMIWSPEAWYTLNKKGPADILGCMDPSFLEFNSSAQYDNGVQCINKLQAVSESPSFKVGPNYLLKKFDPLDLQILDPGDHQIVIRSLKGEKVFNQNGHGRINYRIPRMNKIGIYLITIETTNGLQTKKINLGNL